MGYEGLEVISKYNSSNLRSKISFKLTVQLFFFSFLI